MWNGWGGWKKYQNLIVGGEGEGGGWNNREGVEKTENVNIRGRLAFKLLFSLLF